jgi:hypothetical protein
MADLEARNHTALFHSFEIDDHSDERRWRNAKRDMQVVWTALWNRVDFLVTSDARIVARASNLAAIRPIDILTPPCFLWILEDRRDPPIAAS